MTSKEQQVCLFCLFGLIFSFDSLILSSISHVTTHSASHNLLAHTPSLPSNVSFFLFLFPNRPAKGTTTQWYMKLGDEQCKNRLNITIQGTYRLQAICR